MSEYIRVLNRLQGTGDTALPIARRGDMPERVRDAVSTPLATRAPAPVADTPADVSVTRAPAGCPIPAVAVTARFDALLQRVGGKGDVGPRWFVCLAASGDEPIAPVVDGLMAHADGLGLRAARASAAPADRRGEPDADVVFLEVRGMAGTGELTRLPRRQTAVMIVAEAGRTRRDALDATARRLRELGCGAVGVVLFAPRPYWPSWARRLFARLTAGRGGRGA
jgi:hypothetical protein